MPTKVEELHAAIKDTTGKDLRSDKQKAVHFPLKFLRDDNGKQGLLVNFGRTKEGKMVVEEMWHLLAKGMEVGAVSSADVKRWIKSVKRECDGWIKAERLEAANKAKQRHAL